MQTPKKESPPGAVPQNGSTPLPTTGSKSDCCPSRPSLHRWRKTEQITSLVKFGQIGRRRFMKLAHLAGKLDPRIVPVIEDWERMKPPLQNAVDLDALCEAHDVDPAHFISVVGVAGLKYRDNASVLIAALSMPAVVDRSVHYAMKKGGFKDREALMKLAGFLPQPKGSQVRALNYAAIGAEANTNIGEPLPTFEETIADLDELTGDEE
jgi:hypothetical protein